MFTWLKSIFNRNTVSKLPDGWTDDMSFLLPSGVTEEEIVEAVINAALDGITDEENEARLVALGINENDAALARDRVFGGIVRGTTKNQANCPLREKDPLAWLSFQKTIKDISIAKKIYPQYFTSEKTNE